MARSLQNDSSSGFDESDLDSLKNNTETIIMEKEIYHYDKEVSDNIGMKFIGMKLAPRKKDTSQVIVTPSNNPIRKMTGEGNNMNFNQCQVKNKKRAMEESMTKKKPKECKNGSDQAIIKKVGAFPMLFI